jgi:dihydrofolate reductase
VSKSVRWIRVEPDKQQEDVMQQVVSDIAVSADGYAAGVGQSREQPFGDIKHNRLHDWMFEVPDENRSEIEAITAAGAFIMGRNMFASDRGEWDLEWTGWWGDEPPYHAPVFVLAHRERDDLEMEGGTTFHFVTDGIEAALEGARAAAGDENVAIAGGPNTINQYLAAGLVDELRMHVTPTIIGRGERLFAGVPQMELEQVSSRGTSTVTHIVYRPVR